MKNNKTLLAIYTALILNISSVNAEEITSSKEFFLEDQTNTIPSTEGVVLQENAQINEADRADFSSEVTLFNNQLTIPNIDVNDGTSKLKLDNVQMSAKRSSVTTVDGKTIDRLIFTLTKYQVSSRTTDSLNTVDMATGKVTLQGVQNGNSVFTSFNLQLVAEESTNGNYVFELDSYEGVDVAKLTDSNRASVTPLLAWVRAGKNLGSGPLPRCSKVVSEQRCVRIGWPINKNICTNVPVLKTANQKWYVDANYWQPKLNINFLSQQNVFNAISNTFVTGVQQCLVGSAAIAGVAGFYTGSAAALPTFKASLYTCSQSKISTFATDVSTKLVGGSQSKEQFTKEVLGKVLDVSIRAKSSCSW